MEGVKFCHGRQEDTPGVRGALEPSQRQTLEPTWQDYQWRLLVY